MVARILISAMLFAVQAIAQPALTTITDRLYNSITGTPFNGTVTVQGPNITGLVNIPVLGNSRTINIVDGAFTVQLVPNQSSTPASSYSLTFSNGDLKTCNVPSSATPLTLAAANCVDGSQPPQVGVIALSQLASGGATNGQGLCFNAGYWSPGSCAGTAPAKGTLSTSQILNISTAPVTAIPSQGSGTLIIVKQIVMEVNPGSTRFNASQSITLYYGSSSGQSANGCSAAFLNAVFASVCVQSSGPNLVSVFTTSLINQPIVISSLSSPSTGNGSLNYWIDYEVLTGF